MRISNHVEEFFRCFCAAGGHSNRVGEKSRGPTHCDGENWKVRVEEENKNENGPVFKHDQFSNMIGFQTPGPHEVQKLERFGLTGESMQGEVFMVSWQLDSYFDVHYPHLENG